MTDTSHQGQISSILDVVGEYRSSLSDTYHAGESRGESTIQDADDQSQVIIPAPPGTSNTEFWCSGAWNRCVAFWTGVAGGMSLAPTLYNSPLPAKDRHDTTRPSLRSTTTLPYRHVVAFVSYRKPERGAPRILAGDQGRTTASRFTSRQPAVLTVDSLCACFRI